MPKKIPDLEAKILEAAHQLFLKNGYLAVSMKQVAVEAGTSVGNLYNYFRTKKDLFLAGRKLGLESFQKNLKEKVRPDSEPLEVLRLLLTNLLETFDKLSGLWEDFMAEVSTSLSREDALALHRELQKDSRRMVIDHVEGILQRLAVQVPHLRELLTFPEYRFATSLVSLVKFLVRTYPGELEENRRYLEATLKAFFQPYECFVSQPDAVSAGSGKEHV